MNKIVKTLFIIVVTAISFMVLTSSTKPENVSDSSAYDIVRIYEKQDVPNYTKAINENGSVREVRELYVPVSLDTDRYSVEITRIDSNFYQICGTDFYIETRYCYEYAYREEVILNITSSYGYSLGEVIFFD